MLSDLMIYLWNGIPVKNDHDHVKLVKLKSLLYFRSSHLLSNQLKEQQLKLGPSHMQLSEVYHHPYPIYEGNLLAYTCTLELDDVTIHCGMHLTSFG